MDLLMLLHDDIGVPDGDIACSCPTEVRCFYDIAMPGRQLVFGGTLSPASTRVGECHSMTLGTDSDLSCNCILAHSREWLQPIPLNFQPYFLARIIERRRRQLTSVLGV